MRLLLAIILFCSAQEVLPQSYFSDEMITRANEIIELATLQQHDQALAKAIAFEKAFPDHPAGYFFHAAALQSKMLDFEKYTETEQYFKLTRKVLKLCARDIRTYPDDPWPYFFAGGAYGYDAFMHGRLNNLYKAFQNGWNSIRALENCLKADSTNYDAYLGIGTYKYYRSAMSKTLSWLPFVKDERELGIRMIKRAIARGRLSKSAAMNGLMWIMLHEKRYDEAMSLADSALQVFPGSRYFLWGKASIAFKQEKWALADSLYRHILSTYPDDDASPYNTMECRTNLADIALRQGRYEQAIALAETAIRTKVSKIVRKRGNEVRERAKQIIAASRAHLAAGQ